jgi:metal-responsive CopG/Arc/MetJ family transcriptional regulator
MTSKLPRIGIRLEADYIKKLDHIANSNRRYRNQEICYVLIKYIEEYEKKYGEIDVSALPDHGE